MAASLDNIFGNAAPSGGSAAPAAPSSGPSIDNIFGSAAPAVKPVAATPAPAQSKTASIEDIFNQPPLLKPGESAFKPSTIKPIDTSSLFGNFLGANNMKPLPSTTFAGKTQTSTPAVPAPTAPISDDSILGVAKNTLKGLPEAAIKVSKAINDVVINKPADLLSNTKFIQESAAGIDAGSTGGLFAQEMLGKLSLGLNTIGGVTGGLYQPPKEVQQAGGEDILSKGLSILSQGLGMATGISAIGRVSGSLGVVDGATQGLTNLANKYPLMAKYIAPYIAPLVENAVGFAAYGQLDPKLGGDIKARAMRLLTDVGTAPLYTVLGSIKNPAYSLPASFGLGFGMAKLSGASNEDAVASGAAFAFLDAAGRAGGSRGLSPDEIQAKLTTEALKVLQPYAKGKLTVDSSAEDIKAAYYSAAHQTHPDVGGTHEAFTSVKNAFDILSKGAASKAPETTTEAEKSVGLLHGDIKQAVETHGEDLAHQALREHLGVDASTADRLITASKNPSVNEARAAHERAVQKVITHEGETLPGANPKQATRLSNEEAKPLAERAATDYWLGRVEPQIKEGGPVVIGGDDLKDYFGNDYNDNNHPIYSGASNILLDRALKTNKEKEAVFIGGGPGSGKSELIVNHLKEQGFKGVIYDSNLSNPEGAQKALELAKKYGKEVTIIGILPNLDKARGFTITREKEKGRAISDHTFAHGHTNFPATIAHLIENGHHAPEKTLLYDFRNVPGQSLEEARATIARAGHSKDPLATVKDLGYNKEDLKTLYGKENYNQENGSRNDGAPVIPQESSSAPAENRPSSKRITAPRGMVAPGKMAEDIVTATVQLKETLDKLEQARELTGDVRESIYQHENKRKANRERLTQLMEHVGNLLDSKGWNDLYHYDENKDEQLTPEQKEIYDTVIVPLKTALSSTIKQYKELGGTITSELFFVREGDYTPRFAKDKGNSIDKLLEAGKKVKQGLANGGLLSKSLGTVDKSRKFFAATDALGNRVVVHVPTDKSEDVLAFTKGGIENLGPVKGMRSPKIKEFFDDAVMTKLEALAEELGIQHQRVPTGKSRGLGSKTAGVSFTGRDLVKTRLGPSSVLAHEIGHQIDDKYGLKNIIRDDKYGSEHRAQIKEEMQALADKRFEGVEVTDSFKKYVRKSSEKVAVMFEAYVANRHMFQQVAPHLYDDFRDFLATHEELKPFLDIQPSVTLGSQQHGGEQSGKIGNVFVDKSGKQYTIGQATTKEIEANTKTRYHQNVLANYVVALDRAANALNAMKLLERIKDEKVFGEIIKKDNPDEAAPEGWKTVGDSLPQFRGYHMEPRLAEALTDLGNRQKGNFYLPIFDEINNLLITAIVINPIMHVPNVLAGRGLAAATGSMSAKSFSNLKKAYTEVRNKGPLYLDYLEHGAPFMALKETTKKFTDAILNQYTDELVNDPQALDIAKMLGFKTVAAFGKGFMHVNEAITWGSNDIFFMHALMDYRDARGGTMEEAIREVSKRMGDYRIPERILLPGQAGRALSIASQGRALMFARYHYSGTIKPWLAAMKETAGPGSTAKQRLDGMRAFAYLFLMGLFVYPYLNKLWQGVTGSSTTYMSMAGPIKQIQVGENFWKEGIAGFPRALQSEFTPSPALRSAIELGFNVNLFNHNPIYGPLPAEGLSTYGSSVISPLASASRMNPADFALALFGIWTPKNTESKNVLNQMRYDEKPALQAQVKKDIVSGNGDKANKEMAEFNSRVIATWNQYQLETNGKQLVVTDEEKQAFLKEWGVKQPGEKALTNAAALYADGSLTSKSSLTDTVATYAKAIGVDPVTAFERIFTGQRILRVSHFGLFNPDSAIIVERMPLADSEAVKNERGAAAGMVLDHVIPLEAGGSNDKGNLNLIEDAQNKGEQHTFENFLGQATKDGMISRAKVREYSIRYKVGKGETLPDSYMKEFADKYGSKPMTLQEVEDAVNKGEAK